MANVLGLALRITGDASGLRLDPAQRALQRLGDEADKVGKIFDQFTGESTAAAQAQERFQQEADGLLRTLRDGGSATEFARNFERIAAAARDEAAALQEAARITESVRSPLERFGREQRRLAAQLEAGRITQETYNRALEQAQRQLDQTGREASQAESQIAALAAQVTTISRIQIARLLIDGFRAIAGVARDAARQIQQLVGNVTQSLDEIDKLSLRTGIGREALQGYGVAAELAGVSTDELGATFQRLAANIGRANPPAELTQGLQQLGLTVQQLRGLAPEDQFALIAQRISELPTATQRAGAAFGVLGEQGVRLTSLLQQQGNAIEEVRQRAERLGIIVRDDQIANVTQLNDTFTLVSQTIEGIIGQVTGNLAPVVTALAEEFLTFVEGFEGVNAEGGTALADRITDSLLTGAEVLAGVFDRTVAEFNGFSLTLAAVGEAFSRVTNGLQAAYDTGNAFFNLFESVGNAVTFSVGTLLEQIGRIPFLSDIGETGRALADSAFEQLEANAEQFANSVDSAVNNAGEAIFGETPGEAGERGAGAAEQYIANFRSKIEEARSPEFRVNTNIENTREAFDDFFGGLIDQSSRVTDLMRDFEAAVAAAQEDATLTAEEIATIEDLQKRVNAAIQEELAARNEAITAAAKQADADAKRVDSLLKTSDASQKIIEDLAAVEREIARVQQEIADAGAGDDGTAQARLQQLQALQTQLDDQLQAAAQGFDRGFAAAFDSVGQRFNNLAEQAAQFGEAGIAAAARLQEGIALAQQQAEDGILNREAFDAEVARRERLFQQEIERVREVADERQRINELVDQRFLLARFGGDQQRLDAARNLAALEAEIGRVQQEVQAARAAGQQDAVNAGIARLGQLDQVAAQERDIATGRQQLEEQLAAQRDQYLQQLQQQQEAAQQEQEKFLEEQRKAIEAEQQRQAERLRELNTLGSGVIEGNDIRTAEGAALFLQLAANRQDPALIEARLQTRRLTEIRQEVRALVEGLTGLPVLNIAGGAG
jgi:hypothetical protein